MRLFNGFPEDDWLRLRRSNGSVVCTVGQQRFRSTLQGVEHRLLLRQLGGRPFTKKVLGLLSIHIIDKVYVDVPRGGFAIPNTSGVWFEGKKIVFWCSRRA